MSESKRKLFILDTSVLLYDKNCIKNMSGNDIIIPLIVLEEIDKFKSREGILGENARHINRFLDEIRDFGNLNVGIYLEKEDIKISVETKSLWENLDQLDRNCNDNKIIAISEYIKHDNSQKYNDIILITKDINLRVKCDAVKIKANDYYADYEFIKDTNSDLFTGYKEVFVNSSIIDKIYKNKYVSLHDIESCKDEIYENECLILKSNCEKSSALCIKKFNSLCLVKSKGEIFNLTRIEPKNKEQTFALNMLLDENIPLVTLTGIPGSGKTFLALMTSLNFIEKEKAKRIIFTRPIQTVGKDIGFLPGTLEEKMAPWLAPIVDNFRNQFGDLSYFNLMIEKGVIDVAPLSYIRGRSFNDSIIIVDEAQNATVHELKTVITRTGSNSKILLLGDIDQVDLSYVNKFSNGLTIVTEKMKNSKLTGHISFTKGYRSLLANEASTLL
jgi:PhoH-like ATPase